MSIDNNISVVVPTYNCEKNFRKCLASIKWASEIIVVDMGSVDKTLNLAKKYNAKIYLQRKPKDGNFDWNRLYGMNKAKNDWILKLDSDEELSEALQKELIKFSKCQSDGVDGMYVRNRIYFLGKQICHGPVKSDSMELRLVRKGRWTYSPTRYYQQILVEGRTVTSTNYYKHYNYRSINEFLEKTNKYTELDSEKLKTSYRCSLLRVIFSFPASFVKFYVFQRGFLDGRTGVIICWLYSLYYFIEKIKILEKQRML